MLTNIDNLISENINYKCAQTYLCANKLKDSAHLRRAFGVGGKVQRKTTFDVQCAAVAVKIMHHLGTCKLCIHGSFGAVIIFALFK